MLFDVKKFICVIKCNILFQNNCNFVTQSIKYTCIVEVVHSKLNFAVCSNSSSNLNSRVNIFYYLCLSFKQSGFIILKCRRIYCFTLCIKCRSCFNIRGNHSFFGNNMIILSAANYLCCTGLAVLRPCICRIAPCMTCFDNCVINIGLAVFVLIVKQFSSICVLIYFLITTEIIL